MSWFSKLFGSKQRGVKPQSSTSIGNGQGKGNMDKEKIRKMMDSLENLLRIADEQPRNLKVLRALRAGTVTCMRAGVGAHADPDALFNELSDDELRRDRDAIVEAAKLAIKTWRSFL